MSARGRTACTAILAAASLPATPACGILRADPAPAPVNSCPQNPCEAYAQGTPAECVSGACIVSIAAVPDGGASATSDIVLVVATASDALYAPGRTFVVSFDALRRVEQRDAGTPGTGVLPGVVLQLGTYSVAPSVATNQVRWNLAPVSIQNTTLPVHATFQPIALTNPDGTTVAVGTLPVPPVSAAIQPQFDNYGPAGTPTTLFVGENLQPGFYLRTVTPDPPFDQAFGPAIAQVPIGREPQAYLLIEGYDATGAANFALPAATITRDRGSFDRWTAYLRDNTSHAVISNVAPLHGQSTSVTFAVLRSLVPPDGGPPADPDALFDATLVVAPPPGSVEPAYIGNIFNDVLLPPRYPTLPAPVLVQGSILGADGEPLAADLVFEEVGITDVANGQPQLDTQSFELTRWVAVDPSAAGFYQVVLPPGEYRFDIRPRDTVHALLVRELQVPVEEGPLRVDVSLGTLTLAEGAVAVADGRPLTGAVVQGRPTQCAEPAALSQVASTPWCMPRPSQTVAEDGGFQLELDPGQYTLQALPPSGSRLPWGSLSPLDVTATTASDAGVLVIPAPIPLGLALRDPSGNPIPNALVRAFRTSSQGPAVELGNAVTDATGRYEMYVAPAN